MKTETDTKVKKSKKTDIEKNTDTKIEKKTDAKVEKKTDAKVEKKKKKKVEEKKVEEVVVEEVVVEESTSIISKGTPTKESVLASFDALVSAIDAEVDAIRSGDKAGGGIKFLKSCATNIKKLQKHTARISKTKGKSKSTTPNTNSGFLKPVPVSDDVRKFAGWNSDELHSRVDVTKFICNYVKENNLQNPEDRRRIIPDAKLKKLLGSETKDLRYCDIQTLMKPHFNKV
jgi:chromatin remodeling complex protein RSC6